MFGSQCLTYFLFLFSITACSENFKGNQQTCPQEREEPYFADAENSSCMSSEDDNASLSDPDNCSETPNGCSHQALCSEEITSYSLMASQDDTPVLCLDVSVLNVENEESKDKDDELFETLITENDSPKHSDSSISVTSNQQSPTHPGSITQEAPQSPLRNTWWNDIGDSKLSVAPAQGSDEKIHSGQEWEESGKYSDAIESPMILSPLAERIICMQIKIFSVYKFLL